MICDGLSLENVSYAWASNGSRSVNVTSDFSFDVAKGSFVAVLGPSGCGKSSILQLIAGLESPDSGEIIWNGNSVTGPSHKRGLISQAPKLFPWASVRANAEWGLRMRGVARAERKEITDRILANVGLSNWANRRVTELSGGMQQRLAFARTLANGCELFLMDEPFSGLDIQTRFLMQRFTLDVWGQTGSTILLVTHSINEAILADRVIVLGRRPTHIVEDVVVDLPRPRDANSTEFVALRAKLSAAIEREVMDAASEEGGWDAALKSPPAWTSAKTDSYRNHSVSEVVNTEIETS